MLKATRRSTSLSSWRQQKENRMEGVEYSYIYVAAFWNRSNLREKMEKSIYRMVLDFSRVTCTNAENQSR